MRKATIYILYSGLKYYKPPEPNEDVFYYDPKTDTLYPRSKKLGGYDKYIIVDSNITTGRTVLSFIKRFELPIDKVETAGTPRTRHASRLVSRPLPPPDPNYDKAMLVFSGYPGTLKTFVAKGLEMTQGIPVVQVGKVLTKRFDVGKYGEKLHEVEKDNPFIVGEVLYPVVSSIEAPLVIVDGVKSYETAVFISYATRRPAFIFFFDTTEQTRRLAVHARGDADDQYDDERVKLFKPSLEKLKSVAYAVVDMNDLRTLEPLCNVLESYGFRTTRIAGLPNPFASKLPILELYSRSVLKLISSGYVVREDLSGYVFHVNYPRRLEEKFGVKLTKEQEDVINYTASAFRIVDDILDENTVRDGKPAFWTVHGFYNSLAIAVFMTVKAYNIASSLGVGNEYVSMFRRVVDAVRYELLVEEGRAEFSSFEDWLRAADREAAFREFLAHLIGRPDKARVFYAWGLRAQAKDDLIGETKGGREPTERRLNRPLFKPEWARLLESTASRALSTGGNRAKIFA